jgi:hypothetical protein
MPFPNEWSFSSRDCGNVLNRIKIKQTLRGCHFQTNDPFAVEIVAMCSFKPLPLKLSTIQSMLSFKIP